MAKYIAFKGEEFPERFPSIERHAEYMKGAGYALAGRGEFANERDVARDFANRVIEKTENIRTSTGSARPLTDEESERINKEAEAETAERFKFPGTY